jgi:hypothetical protein
MKKVYRKKMKSLLNKIKHPYSKKQLYQELIQMYYLPDFCSKAISTTYLMKIKANEIFVIPRDFEVPFQLNYLSKIDIFNIIDKKNINLGFNCNNMPDRCWMGIAYLYINKDAYKNASTLNNKISEFFENGSQKNLKEIYRKTRDSQIMTRYNRIAKKKENDELAKKKIIMILKKNFYFLKIKNNYL